MRVYEIQCAKWDRIHLFLEGEEELSIGDYAVIKNDYGYDRVKVVGKFTPKEHEKEKYNDLKVIVRKANEDDNDKIAERLQHKEDDFNVCQTLIKENKLPMKLIDVYYSLDGGRVTFAFISEERVDFRSLVKNLTAKFHKSIRLQQLGARDAVRQIGDIGVCGLEQCCSAHLKELPAISIDMAEAQQVSHRGSDRISGICGRLKCCLLYELDVYKEKAKDLPKVGSIIKIKNNKENGEVVALNILKKSIRVKLLETEVIVNISAADVTSIIKQPQVRKNDEVKKLIKIKRIYIIDIQKN